MNKKLWEPSRKIKLNSNLLKFEKYTSNRFKKKFNNNFEKIHNWTIKNPQNFWNCLWDYAKVKGIKGVDKERKFFKFYKNTFLSNSKLNFTENLLSKNNDDKAITFISENGFREIKNWRDLNINVKKVSAFLRKLNIKSKDRVVAYMPNISETVEAFLGTVGIGSIWSSCSPDFGINGVIERFSQIKPKVLFVTNEYFYNGKKINVLERLPEIINKVPSINKVVLIPYPGTKIETKMTARFTPNRNPNTDNIIRADYTINFLNSIQSPLMVDSTISSDRFSFNNVVCTIRNKKGHSTLLQIVDQNGKVVADNIGNYDPTTGILTLTGFQPQSITSGARFLNITAVPADDTNFKPLRNTLLTLGNNFVSGIPDVDAATAVTGVTN